MVRRRERAVDGAARLRGVEFFAGFSEDELDRVSRLADDLQAESGALLTEQGRVGQECFVIVDGQASVYVGDDFVATVGPGTMVGEMALLEHRPRAATVVADTPMRMLAFDTKRFRTLLDEMPKAGERVNALLAARIRANRAR
ncbi:cyclic nucleotide-binding domain-containing protein [Rhabdothermincola salaria]|uniref:cyclic nucleotide-binding domain-containing protein n=1 Tax=Rhabdothermincola salaria TaxID=2903142 RepID=UPI001E36F2DB|nr:cyclic nucleotide-binding domain-containing protein [Rhabdothermincola salaria]